MGILGFEIPFPMWNLEWIMNPDWLDFWFYRRVATSIFNPFSTTIFTVIAVPLMIAAAYWLFVVNGPTPVVKARIEDFEDISANSVEQEEFSNTDQYEFINQELLINLLKLFVPVVQQESWITLMPFIPIILICDK